MKTKNNKKGNFDITGEQDSSSGKYNSLNDLYGTNNSHYNINELIRRAENDKRIEDFETSKLTELPFNDKYVTPETSKPKPTKSTPKQPVNKAKSSKEEPKEELLIEDDLNEDVSEETSLKDDNQKKKPRRIKFLNNFQICIIGLIIFVLMLFFAENNNVVYKSALKDRLKTSIIERDSLLEEVRKDSVMIERIKHDDGYLEKYARENFYYRADDEDVFIVEPEVVIDTTRLEY
ncbi:MAG: hypothetical protein R3Y51_03365 [Rikenellaceae bacterium]